ncbi:MAG: cytochrome c peroxidase [Verrucomicrobiota bacterium]
MEPAHDLQVQILPQFNGAPLAFDSVTNQIAAGQLISITRLDFLLSDLALRRADGTWLTLDNWQVYLSAREGRMSSRLDSLPIGRYDRIRFHIGLQPNLNHHDPANYPAGHPLNPEINGLHWGWQGGYVFMALEGRWVQPCAASNHVASSESSSSGYSFHIANDPQLMTVDLSLLLDLQTDRSLQLVLDVAKIFETPHRITLSGANSTSHSRTGDTLAAQLRDNIQAAFSVRTSAAGKIVAARSPALKPLVASNATPYRLVISSLFPRPALPLDNPLTDEGVELGQLLFKDKRLSANNRQSCQSCHTPAAAGADPGRAFSLGAEGKPGSRNAMPLFNLAWKNAFFWDGRAASLREQVLQPIQSPIEMHESLTNIISKLRNSLRSRSGSLPLPFLRGEGRGEGSVFAAGLTDTDYPSLFARAFGSPEITAGRIARALEQFLLTQTSHDSKFDRAITGEASLTEQEQRGFQLFNTEYDPRHEQFGADCFHCHGGPLFQNVAFANNGLDEQFKDLGRYEVTKRDGDQGKFAVPSLRNIAVTGPYMHDGRFRTLEEVVEHYCSGVRRSATLDPNLAKHPDAGVPLPEEDKRALVAFLKTLTDYQFQPEQTQIATTP